MCSSFIEHLLRYRRQLVLPDRVEVRASARRELHFDTAPRQRIDSAFTRIPLLQDLHALLNGTSNAREPSANVVALRRAACNPNKVQKHSEGAPAIYASQRPAAFPFKLYPPTSPSAGPSFLVTRRL